MLSTLLIKQILILKQKKVRESIGLLNLLLVRRKLELIKLLSSSKMKTYYKTFYRSIESQLMGMNLLLKYKMYEMMDLLK